MPPLEISSIGTDHFKKSMKIQLIQLLLDSFSAFVSSLFLLKTTDSDLDGLKVTEVTEVIVMLDDHNLRRGGGGSD